MHSDPSPVLQQSRFQMKIMGENLFFTFTILLFTMLITSEAIHHTRVTVKNEIQGERITIHCYSSEDNLGVRDLPSGKNFTWHFHVNFSHSTKFYCDFKTRYGSGNYGVYTRKVHARCNRSCVWLIRETGLCLIQTKHNDRLWCQNWKIRPQSVALSARELPDARE
ncbi:uncharacterized protein LOC105166811 [Sesamum indicum]|uniref:S-protein homolog n=1 Tax=Sesamum indicum TaxID=4182 RepID=A0A6I9TMR6_SESIN|nr:uncharacterized protein LOC105166811 [Sesamum indicum]